MFNLGLSRRIVDGNVGGFSQQMFDLSLCEPHKNWSLFRQLFIFVWKKPPKWVPLLPIILGSKKFLSTIKLNKPFGKKKYYINYGKLLTSRAVLKSRMVSLSLSIASRDLILSVSRATFNRWKLSFSLAKAVSRILAWDCSA